MCSAYIYKVVFAGDGGVGKTTLTQRYLSGVFFEDTKMTIGVGFHIHRTKLGEDDITLQIWDLGGQDQFQKMDVFSSYIKGATGVIVAFDLTSVETLLSLENWLNLIHESAGDLSIVVVGNKSDLMDEREVDDDLIQEFLNSHGNCPYFKTSALTGQNVEESFIELMKLMRERSG